MEILCLTFKERVAIFVHSMNALPLSQLEKRIHYRFKRKKLLLAALTHPSHQMEQTKAPLENFQRLEFLGDAILNLFIASELYRLFPEANEGLLSRLRSILVSKKILFRIARQMGLIRMLKLGRGLHEQEDFLKIKLAADAFEALLGALYLDQGLEQTEKFILRYFRPYFDAKKLFRLDPNPKSTLQELVQKRWQKLPSYLSEITDKGVKTTVSITRGRQASALARTRKESEEKAARFLIRLIRQEALGRARKKSSAGKF